MKHHTLLVAACAVSLISVGIPAVARGNADTTESISFAGSGGYPPFNYLLDNGTVVGFDVDVAAEIAARMGMKLEYVTTAWDGIIEGLRANRYDGILGSMAITSERGEIVDFSDAYYYSGPQLIVRKDGGLRGIADFGETRTVALVTGTTFERDASDAGLKVRLYEDDNQTLMELVNGRVDGVLTDRIVGLNALSKMKGGDSLTLAGSILRTESMGIAFRKGSPLTARVNGVLADMRKDGTMRRISEKWFPGQDITVE